MTDNGPVDAETVSDSAMTVCVSLCICVFVCMCRLRCQNISKGEDVERNNSSQRTNLSSQMNLFPRALSSQTGKKVSRLVFFGREVMMASTFTKVPNQYPSRYCYSYSLILILLPCPSLIFFILLFFALSLLSASESSICAIQRDAVHIHRGCSAQTGL